MVGKFRPVDIRKPPVVVEAAQLGDEDSLFDILGWIDTNGGEAFGVGDEIRIVTSEGVAVANPGDWIIRITQGDFSPCDSKWFERAYEAAL